MNAFLWVLQVLLALHTALGAVWKLSNSQQTAGLEALPHGLWMALSVLELLAAVALLAPAVSRRLGALVPAAASFIAAEMLLFIGAQLFSGAAVVGELVYWLVVAAVCAFLAWGRLSLKPLAAVPAS